MLKFTTSYSLPYSKCCLSYCKSEKKKKCYFLTNVLSTASGLALVGFAYILLWNKWCIWARLCAVRMSCVSVFCCCLSTAQLFASLCVVLNPQFSMRRYHFIILQFSLVTRSSKYWEHLQHMSTLTLQKSQRSSKEISFL